MLPELNSTEQNGKNAFDSAQHLLEVGKSPATRERRKETQKLKRLVSPETQFLGERKRACDVIEYEIIIHDTLVPDPAAIDSTVRRI
jgi:hypothetical protein